MKLHAYKFAIASAISASVLWLVCSLLVMLIPSMMLSMSGDMLHMQLLFTKFLLILMLTLPWLSCCGVNNIANCDEQAKASWTQVENQYQRTEDLPPIWWQQLKAMPPISRRR